MLHVDNRVSVSDSVVDLRVAKEERDASII